MSNTENPTNHVILETTKGTRSFGSVEAAAEWLIEYQPSFASVGGGGDDIEWDLDDELDDLVEAIKRAQPELEPEPDHNQIATTDPDELEAALVGFDGEDRDAFRSEIARLGAAAAAIEYVEAAAVAGITMSSAAVEAWRSHCEEVES